MAKAMTLIRRCLMLVFLYSMATVSIAQMPSLPLDLKPTSPPALEMLTPPNIPTTSVENIASRFKISKTQAAKMLYLASEHAYDTFPTKEDILAIMEIESSFNPNATYIGCYGLMMIQKKSHKDKLRGRNVMDPYVNVEVGASILNEYYLALGKDKKAAILASNAGIGNYLKKRYNLKYYQKFAKAKLNYIN